MIIFLFQCIMLSDLGRYFFILRRKRGVVRLPGLGVFGYTVIIMFECEHETHTFLP